MGFVRDWYNGLPLCTKGTFSLIVGTYAVQLLTGWSGSEAALVPHAVLYDCQVYRLLSSALVHGGLLHVAFNMLAFVPLGTSLERTAGTLQLLHFLLLSAVLGGGLYVAISVLLAASGLVRGALWGGAIGFSGVIFALVVWDSALSPGASRSVFGLFQLPPAWYPVALLLLCQLLLPEASFWGHLAGLMVGQLWVWGYLRPLSLSRAATSWLEQSSPLARCVRLTSFILAPTSALPYSLHDTTRGGGGGGGGSSGSGWGPDGGLGGIGRNFASLGKLFRGRGDAAGDGGGGGSEGLVADVEAGAAGGGGAGQGRGAFAGTGRVLGGGAAAAPAAPTQPPSLAAALAAEARMGSGGAGSSNGTGGGAGTTSAAGCGVGAAGGGGGGQGGGRATAGSRDKPSSKS